MLKVSIVIPTYNRENSIEQAIKSVLNQTYEWKEIIIVDDGSTDNTKQIVMKYSDKIKYIYQENGGVSAARNTGMKNATGEWIAFLDSDDEWKSNKLQMQMDFIESHPGIVAHVTNCLLIGKNYTIDYFNERHLLEDNFQDGIIKKPLKVHFTNWFLLPSIIIKKSILDKTGLFNEKIAIFEDGDFLSRVALCGDWGISFEQLSIIYRRDDDKVTNLSAINKTKKIFTITNEIKNAYSLLEEEQLDESETKFIKKRLSFLFYGKSIIEKQNGKIVAAFAFWFKSLRYDFSLKVMIKGVLLILPYRFSNSIFSLYRKVMNSNSGIMRSNDD